MFRKVNLLVTAILLGALVIAATVIAQQSAAQGNNLRAPVTGGTVRWALEANVAAIDPVWTTATVTFRVSNVLYDSLLKLDLNGANRNNAFEWWEVSDNQLTWSFKLREDMSFVDGTPLTTDDVIASTFRWADRINSGIALFDRTVAGNRSSESMEQIDDYTFLMHMSEPYPIVTSMGFSDAPFIFKAEIANGTPAFDRIEEHVGSGPWNLIDWTPGDRFDFEARPEWTGRVPEGERVLLDALQIIEIPDKTTVLAALKTGQIDYATSPGGGIFEAIKADDKIDYHVFVGGGTGVTLFNWTKMPFSNLKFRQSLQAAMNMEQMQAAYGPRELWDVCGAVFICGTPNESDARLDLYDQRDMEKAQRLFQEAVQETGWDPSTEIVVLGNTSFVFLRDHSIVSAAILREIGFNVDHQMPDWATAVTLRQDKNYWDTFYTACCGVPFNNPVQNWFMSPATYGWIDSPELEALRREYTRVATDEERQDVIDQVQTVYYEQAIQPIYGSNSFYHAWRGDNVVGIHDNLRNTRMTNVQLDDGIPTPTPVPPTPTPTSTPTPTIPTPTPTPTPACTLNIELDYTEGNLDLGFLIGTKEPALWSVWLIFRGQFIPLWGIPIIVPIDPPAHVPTLSVPVPPSGPLMFFTSLTTSEGIACWDFDLIDTGAPSSQALSVSELRGLFGNANATLTEDTR